MGIQWQDEYCTGVACLDELQYRLVGMLEALARGGQAGAGEVREWLDGFHRLAETLFSTEERLAADAGVPARVLSEHRAEHAAYRERLRLFLSPPGGDGRGLPARLLAFLFGWWQLHLAVGNRELARWLCGEAESCHG